jgi:hypothetical protein
MNQTLTAKLKAMIQENHHPAAGQTATTTSTKPELCR